MKKFDLYVFPSQVKSNAAKVRSRQLAELEAARLASFPALPRVNVNSSSSDEDADETSHSLLQDKTTSRNKASPKKQNSRTIDKSPDVPHKTIDGDVKSRHNVKHKSAGVEGKDRGKSPPRAGRVAEAQHTR